MLSVAILIVVIRADLVPTLSFFMLKVVMSAECSVVMPCVIVLSSNMPSVVKLNDFLYKYLYVDGCCVC
jgi:hypothetical protein